MGCEDIKEDEEESKSSSSISKRQGRNPPTRYLRESDVKVDLAARASVFLERSKI
jgi:hypothetical protein